MSAPMKAPRIKKVEITIHGEKDEKFIGPKGKLRPILKLLSQCEFQHVEDEGNIPWEDLAKARIHKYSKPGLALRGARIKEGLSQVELAKKLGIPQYNLSKMENGSRSIGKKMALRLAEILKIDYRVFL